MDKELFLKLIIEAEKIDPQNEVLYEQNQDKRFIVLSNDINETIEFLDCCSKKELDWASESFGRLCEHFKSEKLLKCVERNLHRFDDDILYNQLKMEYDYMKKIIDK